HDVDVRHHVQRFLGLDGRGRDGHSIDAPGQDQRRDEQEQLFHRSIRSGIIASGLYRDDSPILSRPGRKRRGRRSRDALIPGPGARLMRPIRRGDGVTVALLRSGIAVPLLYYGVQLVAAPFFADFSVLSTTASELGSDRSSHPWIFKLGAIFTGIAAIVAS